MQQTVASNQSAQDQISALLFAGESDEQPESGNGSAESLKSAFDIFNELSLQLADSYQQLEQRVADLTDELDSVSEQRLSELKQKEQLANRLETLIQSLPGGVVVLDNRGIIIETNPVAESLLKPQLKGQQWRELIQDCFAPRDDDGHEVSTRDGRRISIVTRSMVGDGQIILLTDQTETRRLQAQVSRNERLSALGKMVSTLAHQVRTPLSSAMLYANHLSDNQLSENQRQSFTDKLLNRLHYMERQVRDMLLFAKGEVPLGDTLCLNQLMHTFTEAIEMPLRAYQATCQWQVDIDDCVLQCNLDALTGALLNLVNNSLQASHDPDICIHLALHPERQNHLAISVLDRGPGLDPASAGQIGEMFFTTKAQGTGIGLSVVNVVAQSHGGSFQLENRPQGGVCACLSLPLQSHSSFSPSSTR